MSSCSTDKAWIKNDMKTDDGLHDIEVINENIALAYSYGTGNLYKTFDEGKNWEKIYQFDSIYFEQIQFLDKENGWIVGSPNKIYATQDGGKSWLDKSLKGESEESLIYGMWFDNKSTGYISANERGKKGFDTKIFKTQDAGNSWNLLHQMDELILNLERIDNVLYASGNNVILKNVDKDKFEYVYQDTSKQVGQIRDLEKSETGKIYATGFNGFIIEINDQKFEKKQITQNRLRCLVSNGNEWIAVGDTNNEPGNLFISKDEGRTWEANTDELSDIHRIEASKGKLWMVGKEGLMMTRKR